MVTWLDWRLININVYGSDQNRASHLLKVIGASNNVFSPLGGDKWLLKNVFVIESFIQEIRSKMLIHPVMKQVKY